MWTVFWTVFLFWIIGMAILPILKLFAHWGQFLLSDEGKTYLAELSSMNSKETGESFKRRLANWEKSHEAKGENKENT